MTTPEQEAAQRRAHEESRKKVEQLQREKEALQRFREATRQVYYQLSEVFQHRHRLRAADVFSPLEKARSRASRYIGQIEDEIADELEDE